MSFRKRNAVVTSTVADKASGDPTERLASLAGTRASLATSQPVTSTGTVSLDSLLGGHGGLPLGCSLLIEENGATDFAGALLKYFVAEGICQHHVLHVVGVDEGWVRNLPAVADEKKQSTSVGSDHEKMKIAWRYERLGQTGERTVPTSSPYPYSPNTSGASNIPFCHTFDLTKRINIPDKVRIKYIRIAPTPSPFWDVLKSLEKEMSSSNPEVVHRIAIPMLLNPAIYHPQASQAGTFLRFIHSLRAFMSRYNNRVVAMMSLPLDLYPRSSALIRTAEILSDGVICLTPFPHPMDSSQEPLENQGLAKDDEQLQGLVQIYKMPINTERGEGGAGAGNSIGEDLAFAVSRRKFLIRPFALPPLEGDQEAQQEAKRPTKNDVTF